MSHGSGMGRRGVHYARAGFALLLLACGLSVLPWVKRKIDLVGYRTVEGIIFLCRVRHTLGCIRGYTQGFSMDRTGL